MEYDTIKYRGFNINIEYDQDPENPRTAWYEPITTMVCWHNRHSLGDSHKYFDPIDLFWYLVLDINQKYGDILDDTITSTDYVNSILSNIIKNHYHILPLYLYDHSGITMSTGTFSCLWDSGQVGYIYISKKNAEKEWPDKTEKDFLEYLESDVEVYDNFLTGQVYGYTIDSVDWNKITCDGSCWGYYGDEGIKQLTAEAKQEIDYAIEQYKKEKIRDHEQKLIISKFMRECWSL